MRRPGRKILAVAVGRLAGMRGRDPNTVSVLLWARTADIRWKGLCGLLMALEPDKVRLSEHQVLFLLPEHGAARLHLAVKQDGAAARFVGGGGRSDGHGQRARRLEDQHVVAIFVGDADATEGAKHGACTIRIPSR